MGVEELIAAPGMWKIGLALMVAGWVSKVVIDFLVGFLRARAKAKVDAAAAKLAAAKETPEVDDDKLAEMALDRAKLSQDFADKLADSLSKNRPT